MRYERLGDSSLDIPALILGCGNFGGIGSSPELFGHGDDKNTAFALLDHALTLGITMFDTANSYGGGRSEEWLGQWAADRGVRDNTILTTKVRNPVGPRPQDSGLSRRHIHEQIDASLRRLRTDRIDLYLAHAPDPSTPIEETIGAFDELIQAGKILHYGLSNYTGDTIEQTATTAHRLGAAGPANLQCGYNLLDRTAAADAFDTCSRHNIGLTPYSPLAGGWLTGKYRADQPFPEGSRMTLRPDWYGHLSNDATFTILKNLENAAAERDLSLPTMALAWALTDPAVTALVIGARSPEQLTSMCAALDVPLTPPERATITRIADGRPG
ncbi:aldo/keto reductase [Streptosporangium sp. 'caverna']|uniref:aldo/keto reductase n=1 Tax=Streptosporangium sp. 'caverna' TaxID=2202249 RepID=UPI000D7DA147|nr:aldo/keto reductase [Streptosporangium sp. 'caverna']AWS43542.1 aldo/keto reductase [Streptosporangium sp. 'caverna']